MTRDLGSFTVGPGAPSSSGLFIYRLLIYGVATGWGPRFNHNDDDEEHYLVTPEPQMKVFSRRMNIHVSQVCEYS